MTRTRTADLVSRRNDLVARGLFNTHPVFVREAYGAQIIDVDGNEYIDLTSGIGVNSLGHAHPAILEAVHGQADKFLHTCFQVGMYESYLTLADRLHQLTPGEFKKKTFFVTSGAEAVEGAVKFARAYTGRDAVISLHLAFHGRTFYALQLTSRAKPYRDGFRPLAVPIHRIPFPYVYRFRGEDPQACVQASLDALDALFQCELPPEAFAALIFEPIQGEAGIVVPPDDFFQRLAEICRTHGILLIADEVQTGVGRTGTFCASSGFGVEPDLIAFAKALGFGLPIGAVTGRAEVVDSLGPGGLGGTMGGNPVACEAALAGLEVLEAENLSSAASAKGSLVLDRLRALQQECMLVGDVRGRGLMIGVELVKDRRSKEPAVEEMDEIVTGCRTQGLLILYGGAYQNMVRLLPPLTIGRNELEQGLTILESVIRQVAGRA